LVFFSSWRSLGVLGVAALNELTFLVRSISYPQQAVSKKFLIEDEQKMKVSERCGAWVRGVSDATGAVAARPAHHR
jgi:hypothetical protein